MKEVLGFSVNGTQSSMEPSFSVEGKAGALAIRRDFCSWLGLQQIAELRKHMVLVLFAGSAIEIAR